MLISKNRYDSLMENRQCISSAESQQKTEHIPEKREQDNPTYFNTSQLDEPSLKLYNELMKIDKHLLNHNEKGEVIIRDSTLNGSDFKDIIRYLITKQTNTTQIPKGAREVLEILPNMLAFYTMAKENAESTSGKNTPNDCSLPQKGIRKRGHKDSQTGGMFVKRINLPGVKEKRTNLKTNWLKY